MATQNQDSLLVFRKETQNDAVNDQYLLKMLVLILYLKMVARDELSFIMALLSYPSQREKF
jgi:hypothetical protein